MEAKWSADGAYLNHHFPCCVLTGKPAPLIKQPLAHDENRSPSVVSMDWKWFFICSGAGYRLRQRIFLPGEHAVYFKVTSTP
ncbi:hypothetical protein KCP71_25305 [Salmonella enterica subsp. enterica]|nr:hypothetical protein KCP71_25305 [Salmonella enterica subsp. enterica]